MTQLVLPFSIDTEIQNHFHHNSRAQPPKIDQYYGDDINNPPKSQSTRIYFQNINGARTYEQWNTWQRSIQKLNKFNINICGTAETNLEWNQKSIDIARNHIKRTYHSVKFTTSNSNDSGRSDYQPGGTSLLVTDKWTGSVISNISDKTALGRWTGYRIKGKQNHHISIFCGYRPTMGTGVHTCYQQQINIYQKMGFVEPDPRRLWYNHITIAIQKQINLDDEIILMLDANDTITQKSDLMKFMDKLQLLTLVQPNIKQPASYKERLSLHRFHLRHEDN